MHCRLLDPERDCQLHRSQQTANRTGLASHTIHRNDPETTKRANRPHKHSAPERTECRACLHDWLVNLLRLRHPTRRDVPPRLANSGSNFCRIYVAPLPTANGQERNRPSSRRAASSADGSKAHGTPTCRDRRAVRLCRAHLRIRNRRLRRIDPNHSRLPPRPPFGIWGRVLLHPMDCTGAFRIPGNVFAFNWARSIRLAPNPLLNFISSSVNEFTAL